MLRILVIEDERDIAGGLKDDLEVDGYEVELAHDGETGLALARANDYSLILLDLMLPGRDGIEVCRDLRRRGDRTPIIMLTARTSDREKVEGLDCGADDYVTKPFSPTEVRARIRAVLRRRSPEGGRLVRFGPWELDVSRIELRRDGEPVRLTPIEFKLLSVMAQEAGRPFSRHELIDRVWGADVYVADRTVDAHIAYLRRKIEDEPSAPEFVVSVRGVGYRFDG